MPNFTERFVTLPANSGMLLISAETNSLQEIRLIAVHREQHHAAKLARLECPRRLMALPLIPVGAPRSRSDHRSGRLAHLRRRPHRPARPPARIDRCHLYGQCIGGSFIMSLLKAQPQRIASAVLAQPIGRVGAMAPGRSARFDAWAETLKDHPEATKQVPDAFHQNLYGPGFLYSVDRAFVSSCRTPCLVLAGNDEAHPFAISEETAKLLPNCEFIREWKEGAPLAAAKLRIKEFLSKHTLR